MLRRDDHVLALTYQDDQKMLFEFRSRQMGTLVALFGVCMGAALWFWRDQISESALWAYWFLWLLLGAMLVSTIASLTTRRTLLVNKRRGLVEFKAKTLFRNTHWTKTMGDFKEIRIYRPIAGTGAGRAVWLKVLVKTQDGQEIPVGSGFLGIYGMEQARKLAERLASMMSLLVIEEPSV